MLIFHFAFCCWFLVSFHWIETTQSIFSNLVKRFKTCFVTYHVVFLRECVFPLEEWVLCSCWVNILNISVRSVCSIVLLRSSFLISLLFGSFVLYCPLLTSPILIVEPLELCHFLLHIFEALLLGCVYFL